MLEFNLTQRERQIVLRLLELAQHTKQGFRARLIDPDAAGPSSELAHIEFGDEKHGIELTKRDLRVLQDEGFIHFRWDDAVHGRGRLSSRAFDAEASNFNAPGSGNGAALKIAAIERALVADELAIAMRFQKVTGELVNLIRRLIDEDEALAAQHEATAIAEQLGKAVFDETIVTRKTKGFVSRLSLTFSGTADLAAKGVMIGEFGERLGAWLVALSVWTDWHAAHHAAPDPCA